MREILMIVFTTVCTIASQMLVKYGVGKLAIKDPTQNLWGWLWGVMTSLPIVSAVVIQAVGFLVWVVVVTRVKIGAAFAISGAFFYVLIALSAWVLYGERLGVVQWLGIALISTGVLLMIQK